MTNNSIDNAFDENDALIEINLVNKFTGETYPLVPAHGENTLGQIFNEYAKDIGINKKHVKILFENKRTGVETPNREETVKGLGLQAGDVLAIGDYDFAGPAPTPPEENRSATGRNYNRIVVGSHKKI